MLSTAKATFIKNFSSHLLWQIVTVVSGFILPPLIISHYGSTVNGFLASAKHFIFYLSIVEAGIGAASIASLYKPLTDQNFLRRNQILGETRRLYRISGILFILCLFMLAAAYSLITRNQLDNLPVFQIILILGLTNIADFFFIGTYRVLLVADQKTYAYSVIQSVSTITNIILAYWLITHNYDVLTAQYSLIAATVLRIAATYGYIRYAYRKLSPASSVTNTTIRATPFIAQKKEAFIQQICLLVIYGTPMAYIVIFCNLKDASIYAIYYLVFAALKMLLQSLSNGTQALFGKLLSEQNIQVVRYHYHRYETLFINTTAAVFCCTAALLMPFISLYTRNMTDAEYYQPVFAFIFLFSTLADCLRIPGEIMIQAAGHFKATRNRYILEACLNVAVTGIFAYLFGLNGVVFASFLIFFWRFIDINYYINHRILRMPATISLMKHLVILIIGGGSAYTLNLYIAGQTIIAYTSWLYFSTICVLTTGSVFYILFSLLNKHTTKMIPIKAKSS